MTAQAVMEVGAKMEMEVGEEAKEQSCMKTKLLDLKLEVSWLWWVF
jgi:hypothetical protein